MRKILMVMRREYLTVIRNRMFWLGTLAIPFGILLVMGLSIAAQFISPEKQKPLLFIENGSLISTPVIEGLSDRTLSDDEPTYPSEFVDAAGDTEAALEAAKQQVLDGELYAIVVIGDDIEAPDNFRIFRKAVGDFEPVRAIEGEIQNTLIGVRLEREQLDISRAQISALIADVDLESFQVSDEGDAQKKGAGSALLPTFAFIIILFFALYFYGYSMARGVIQEKTTRVMEVLLGSMSANQLMAGKILGIGAVGLTQMGIYWVFGTVVNQVIGRATLGFVQDMPEEVRQTMMDALSLGRLAYFVIFFLLGYFLFVSLFAIVGAVCNSEQDAQSLQFPVMMCLMIPYLTTFFFVRHPDSLPAVIMSMIPLFTPMVMFMRVTVLTPPFWQIALSIVLMLGTIFIVMRAAAKVFRIGTLMYGKRPSVPEILRWARS